MSHRWTTQDLAAAQARVLAGRAMTLRESPGTDSPSSLKAATRGGRPPGQATGPAGPDSRTHSPPTLEDTLNKTERRFWQHLRWSVRVGCGGWCAIQPFKLYLGHKCCYTPDFFSRTSDGLVTAWEVKGFWRDDARVKIKVAARMYPWIRFVAVQWQRGAWKEEVIRS